jgi:hypothetical protein
MYLRPVLLQDYFGTILRYYFVAGAEIVPQKGLVTETKHLLEYYFLRGPHTVWSHMIIYMHMDSRVWAITRSRT